MRTSKSEPKRARRRRDLERMKDRAERAFGKICKDQIWRERTRRLANHMAHCRKSCCNRPRKHHGPTFQERKNEA